MHFFGSHTFVPISWMCKKQTSVSHSSTESEIISLNGETSDTNDNVKTKIQRNINTKHMEPDNDVTHLVNT